MKQNSAEQPYEAYERLKKELEEVNEGLNTLNNNRNRGFKITYVTYGFRNSFKLNSQTRITLIEVLESKKQQIENELNNLVNGN